MRLLLLLLAVPLLAVLSLVAYAQAAPMPSDPVGLVQFIVDAYKAKNWQPLVSASIALLVYGYQWLSTKTSLLSKIPGKAVPWVAMAMGTLAAIGTGLLDTSMPWYLDAAHGLATGAAATGLWEALFQYVLPAPPAQPSAPPSS